MARAATGLPEAVQYAMAVCGFWIGMGAEKAPTRHAASFLRGYLLSTLVRAVARVSQALFLRDRLEIFTTPIARCRRALVVSSNRAEDDYKTLVLDAASQSRPWIVGDEQSATTEVKLARDVNSGEMSALNRCEPAKASAVHRAGIASGALRGRLDMLAHVHETGKALYDDLDETVADTIRTVQTLYGLVVCTHLYLPLTQ
jgi:hypothetical protein